MPSRAVIDEFLAGRRIAFVGASRDGRQFANSVYRGLRGPDRVLVPVHPHADLIEGDPAVADPVAAGAVDGVVIMLPAAAVPAEVLRWLDAGVPRVWLHRGAGSAPPPQAVQACHDRGIPVVDGACPLMFVEPVGGIHRAHRWLVRRRIAS